MLNWRELSSFDNLSLRFILKIFWKFCKFHFQPQYSYRIYSYKKKVYCKTAMPAASILCFRHPQHHNKSRPPASWVWNSHSLQSESLAFSWIACTCSFPQSKLIQCRWAQQHRLLQSLFLLRKNLQEIQWSFGEVVVWMDTDKKIHNYINSVCVWSLGADWLIGATAYPCFGSMKQLEVFLLPLDRMLVHYRSLLHNLLGFSNNSLVPIYTPGWREVLSELIFLPKNTTVFQARAQARTTSSRDHSALNMRPPNLHIYIINVVFSTGWGTK